VSSLELRDVVKHYKAGNETVRALDRVSLTVNPSEFVAIYGPSGSGKTTLLKMSAALMRPDSGGVRFGDVEVGSLSADEGARYRREQVGIVSQSFNLIAGASALDNVGIGVYSLGIRSGEAERIAHPWLERVGLGGQLQRCPAEMSMGERQRVAIARALASSPRLVLADEPTGNLDTIRGHEILTLLRDIGRDEQIPVLLVTHDPQAMPFVDRVFTLRDGQLTEGLSADLQPTF
jgi:putative ABC transport system ATP-binding protein